MIPWREAWQDALYGPRGFYLRPEGPAGHFRTAAHAAPRPLARAVARLARHAGCDRVVDLGAGRGELLAALAAPDPNAAVDNGENRLALHGCDVVDRPADLPPAVGWSAGLDALPDAALDGALVVGWELLDVVPCPVVETDPDGVVRVVLVDPATGVQHPGDPVGADDAAWLARWWPLGTPGDRAEVGRPRDELWAALVGRCAATPRGAVLLAVDYAHVAGARPPSGTLAGYRAGRLVRPVPDGSCDVTAHVAIDAVAAAGHAAGADAGLVTAQRTALLALGLRPAGLPTPCRAPPPARSSSGRSPRGRPSPSCSTPGRSAGSAGSCTRWAARSRVFRDRRPRRRTGRRNVRDGHPALRTCRDPCGPRPLRLLGEQHRGMRRRHVRHLRRDRPRGRVQGERREPQPTLQRTLSDAAGSGSARAARRRARAGAGRGGRRSTSPVGR